MLHYVLIGIFVTVNVLTFVVVALDKRHSLRRNSATRTPEGIIFFLAAALGAAGVYAGMLLLRHKTRKWYFQIGIPLLILQNLATMYLALQIIFTGSLY